MKWRNVAGGALLVVGLVLCLYLASLTYMLIRHFDDVRQSKDFNEIVTCWVALAIATTGLMWGALRLLRHRG